MTALPAASITSSAFDDLDALNAQLEGLRADQRVAWALQHGPQNAALSSSFGAQSAVTLHLLSQQRPDIPVILIDTGYLFPETYRFADALTERLKLNLKVYRPLVSRAWMEARHGRLWEQGMVGIDQYNNLRKVEPMRRALNELDVGTWFTGLRRSQSGGRAQTPIMQKRGERYKISPIADWTDRDVWQYLQAHDLPYHPLWEQGYVSIGDFHTTRRWEPGMREEDTRFTVSSASAASTKISSVSGPLPVALVRVTLHPHVRQLHAHAASRMQRQCAASCTHAPAHASPRRRIGVSAPHPVTIERPHQQQRQADQREDQPAQHQQRHQAA